MVSQYSDRSNANFDHGSYCHSAVITASPYPVQGYLSSWESLLNDVVFERAPDQGVFSRVSDFLEKSSTFVLLFGSGGEKLGWQCVFVLCSS